MTNQKNETLQSDGTRHLIRDMNTAAQLPTEELDRRGIIHPTMEDKSILNSFRDVRNKLLRMADYKNFVCLVTSLNSDHDTSLLAINLAAVFAFDKARSALVIDCDSKSTIIDSLITVEDHLGLIDFIEAEHDDMSTLLYDSGIERVRLISAGQVNAIRTETLESTRMREIILELKKRYDDRYVFINAPNMNLSSEVQILANISDMVIFEISAGTVSPTDVSEAVEMIGPDKVAGMLFRDY